MLTGTPLDLTPFGGLLAALGWLYWLIVLGIILVALWWPKRWWVKAVSAAIVAAAVVYPVFVRPVEKRIDVARAEQEAFKSKLDAAAAHFETRCKNAGEKITRTVENVEGVVWMRWREKYDVDDDYDQFKLSDPYGRDCSGDACIRQLLRASKGLEHDPTQQQPYYVGYRYVESTDPNDGKLYRYSLRLSPKDPQLVSLPDSNMESEPAGQRTARYGITWEDISTREDREHWVAGGAIKIIDLQTNETIAERVGYMMDRGLGSRAGFRSPWKSAPDNACPPFDKAPGGGAFRSYRGRQFILNVLKPAQ